MLHCQSLHTEVRARCVEFLRKNRKTYEAVGVTWALPHLRNDVIKSRGCGQRWNPSMFKPLLFCFLPPGVFISTAVYWRWLWRLPAEASGPSGTTLLTTHCDTSLTCETKRFQWYFLFCSNGWEKSRSTHWPSCTSKKHIHAQMLKSFQQAWLSHFVQHVLIYY